MGINKIPAQDKGFIFLSVFIINYFSSLTIRILFQFSLKDTAYYILIKTSFVFKSVFQ